MRWANSALAALLLLGGCAQLPGPGRSAATPLPIEVYGPKRGSDVRTVVAIVDGGDGMNAERSAFARNASQQLPDSAAVTILPPIAGGGSEETLSIGRIRAIGATLAVLRQRYPSARLVLLGDATGAALAADVAGTHHALIDGLVLLSCPCTLPEWREHNGGTVSTGAPDLDPLLTAGGIEPDMRAAILVGASDERTPVRFSRAYAEALALRGIATDFRVLPGQTHDILGAPETLDAVRRIVASLSGLQPT
ncbi:alpha/beta hydrolase family protein [Sphingomonas japonica]|uniref:Pimeloyl-ACP methyl ester carboxylesterase n=1 Tax=Sphingomonas japonica TaxID=511662 RepID=A0ABX0U6M2_9SPHN|nr:hypothetical protein [Sphingomonas japonica]NIJ24982.1 pimeloyl-ACP methyl ester carboxylesterase [Sphingomonas japonica]